MKLIKFLGSRTFVTGVLIAVQLVWLVLFWLKLSAYSNWVSGFFTVLSIAMILVIISKDENPSFKIPWVVIIMALPLLGGLLYVFFGSKEPLKRISGKIARQNTAYLTFQQPNQEIPEILALKDQRIFGTMSYLQNTCHFPAWGKTQTTYYPVGEKMYEAMLESLEKAEHFIFMEYFIIEDGVMWQGLIDILKRKVAEGLDVRLIYDDIGCLTVLPRHFDKQMEALGIKCMAFNPFIPFLSAAMNNRDHRKIMVIDGHTAFNGGINLADEYINVRDKLGHWKDTGIKLVGDAVWNFTVMFLEMWNAFRHTDETISQFAVANYLPAPVEGDGLVVPFGDSPLDGESIGQNIYLDILNQAKHYVYIFTPYLIIDDEMQNALRNAAKRGVDVRIIIPGVPDKQIIYRLARSYYPILLAGGVKIYEYTPGFLHAKSYVCDDELAVVGTINMDFRSLYLHFECGTLLYRTDSVQKLKTDFLETLAKSRQVMPKDKYRFSPIDAIIRVFSPLM